MARNIELKARCSDLARAEAACERLGARRVWTRRQTDLYFRVPSGRLKLRIQSPGGAELVSYQRADAPEARESQYEITPVAHAQQTLAALGARHGIAARVEKTRTLYVLANVRIHLDRVAGLGTFVEFEAVLSPGDDETKARATLERLRAELELAPADLVAGSYADLVGSDAAPGATDG